MGKTSTRVRVLRMVLFLLLVGAWLFVMPARSDALDPDRYENDDAYLRASVIRLDDLEQYHTFHDAGDEDWVKFYGLNESWYYIRTKKVGKRCNTIMELYYEDGSKIEEKLFDRTYGTREGEPENIQWQCLLEGVYYLRVKQASPSVFGERTNYALFLWDGTCCFPAWLKGVLRDRISQEPIIGAKIAIGSETEGRVSDLSEEDGSYLLEYTAGTYELSVSASGYEEYTAVVKLRQGKVTRKDILLRPLAQEPADLVARSVSGPATARRGQWVEVKSSVANKGSGSAGPFHVGIYLTSDDEVQLGEDRCLGGRDVSELASGKTSKETTRLKLPLDLEAGTYMLGVFADPGEAVHESKRDNNASVSKATISIQ